MKNSLAPEPGPPGEGAAAWLPGATLGPVTVPPEGEALGPAPVPTEVPTGPAARVLGALRQRGGPVTIRELTEELGGHPNTVRLHLQRLVAEGWVVEERAPVAGRGRPARVYRAAPHATASTNPVAEEYLGLATAFAAHLGRGEAPAREAREVGRLWGATLAARSGDGAGSPGDAAEAQRRARTEVIGLLDGLGFSPVDDGPERPVRLRTCPILAAARENPEVICSVHLGLVEGALEARGGSGEGVSLRPFAAPGSCHLLVPAPPR